MVTQYCFTTGSISSFSIVKRDIPDLKFFLESSSLYRYSFDVIFSGSCASQGIRLGVAGPTPTTTFVGNVSTPQAIDGVSSVIHGQLHLNDDSVVSITVPQTNIKFLANISGLIMTNLTSSGDLRARFAAEVASGSCGVTVFENSVGVLEKISP